MIESNYASEECTDDVKVVLQSVKVENENFNLHKYYKISLNVDITNYSHNNYIYYDYKYKGFLPYDLIKIHSPKNLISSCHWIIAPNREKCYFKPNESKNLSFDIFLDPKDSDTSDLYGIYFMKIYN